MLVRKNGQFAKGGLSVKRSIRFMHGILRGFDEISEVWIGRNSLTVVSSVLNSALHRIKVIESGSIWNSQNIRK